METVLYEYHFDYFESLILLIPFIVGLGFFSFWKWHPVQNPGVSEKGTKGHMIYIIGKYVGWIVGTLSILLGVLCLSAQIIDYQDKKQLLESGDVYCVEGYTENYHAMSVEGHETEYLKIDGVLFEYTNFEIVNGYNCPAAYGGVITKNGQYLKIKYITDEFGNNTILYIAEIEKT